jgi:hypothetical protein
MFFMNRLGTIDVSSLFYMGDLREIARNQIRNVNNSYDIIDSPDHPGIHNNLQSEIRRVIKKSARLFPSVARIFRYPNINQKLPYDNAAMPVKQIDASE